MFEDELRANGSDLYNYLNRKRSEYTESMYEESIKYVTVLNDKHKRSIGFINMLVHNQEAEAKRYLIEENQAPETVGPGGGTAGLFKTLILMDATGSMSKLIDQTKNTIETMFKRAFEILRQDANQRDKAFQIKICAYRNYSSPVNKILQMSDWQSDANILSQFLASVKAECGQGNEAIELGLWQANCEQDLSQVILIGDAPANDKDDVREKRAMNQALSQSVYATPTYYENELAKLVDKNIQVHAYYVAKKAKKNFEEIAQASGGKSEFLNIHSPDGSQLLVDLVTKQVLRNIGGEELARAYSAHSW